MRILHLLSNSKLTGPAEPAINLCASLKRMGYEVMFACGSSAAKRTRTVEETAIQRGLEPIGSFRLNKHLNIRDNLHDWLKLPSFIKKSRVDIVHTHLDNDHLMGGLSARRTGTNVVVIRSCYFGEGMKPTLRNRYLMGKLTDGLIVASEAARVSTLQNFDFTEGRVWVVDGAIDLQRFDPARRLPDMRPSFGLDPSDFVVGVVARIQPHRRFDMLLAAMKILSQKRPEIKLLIVGRGSNMNWVAVEPVQQMGLGRWVKFAGYHKADNYVATLACFDAKIFLMPGTDGTCRAVREAMAMGKPIIAAKRGMLPEIVDHGVNGYVIDDTPEAIADAILKMATDKDKTKQMGIEARKKACETYSLNVQATSVARIYEGIFQQPAAKRRENE